MLLSCVLKVTGVPVLPGWLVVHAWVHGWVGDDGRRWILIQKKFLFSLTVRQQTADQSAKIFRSGGRCFDIRIQKGVMYC